MVNKKMPILVDSHVESADIFVQGGLPASEGVKGKVLWSVGSTPWGRLLETPPYHCTAVPVRR